MLKQIIQIIWRIIWHRLLARFQQFLKYCLGGGIAFIIDVGGLYVLTEYVGIWYLYSATLSFITAAIFNYLFQKKLTFKSESKKYIRQFLLFVAVALVGLAINNSLLYVQVEYLHIWYILAKGIAAVVVLVWNFFANKYITFKYI